MSEVSKLKHLAHYHLIQLNEMRRSLFKQDLAINELKYRKNDFALSNPQYIAKRLGLNSLVPEEYLKIEHDLQESIIRLEELKNKSTHIFMAIFPVFEECLDWFPEYKDLIEWAIQENNNSKNIVHQFSCWCRGCSEDREDVLDNPEYLNDIGPAMVPLDVYLVDRPAAEMSIKFKKEDKDV